MNFDEEIKTLKICAISLNWLMENETNINEIIDKVLEIETLLWRARINIEHKLSQK